MIKYTWKYNPALEAGNIIFTCSDISHRFFQDAGFFVVPKPLSYTNSKSVYLPDLNYASVKDFWSIVSRREFNIPVKDPVKVIKQISNQLTGDRLLSQKQIDQIKKDWLAISSKFDKLLKNLFPDFYPKIERILIMPTQYGSIGSYCVIDKTGTIPVYIRSDCSIGEIIHLILLSVVHSLAFKYEKDEKKMLTSGKWRSKQGIAEFLITNTAFKALARNLPKDLPLTQKQLKESHNFLETIGFFRKDSLTVRNNKLYNLPKHKNIDNLTKSEEKLLRVFIRRKGEVVSFEQIGEILWGARIERKYSLYAITRLIADIRRKLRDNQIFTDLICTKRGEGYVLND